MDSRIKTDIKIADDSILLIAGIAATSVEGVAALGEGLTFKALPFIGSGEGDEVSKYDKKATSEYQKMLRGKSKVLFNHVATKHSDLALERLEGDSATVSFKLHNFGSATPMRLKLVKENGNWQIDNFISLGEYPTDLKAQMLEYIKE